MRALSSSVIVLLVALSVSACGGGSGTKPSGPDGAAGASADTAVDTALTEDGAIDGADGAVDGTDGAETTPAAGALVDIAAMGVLRGHVLDVDTRAPIAGATVTPNGGEPAHTDTDGSFSLTVPHGRARLTVVHDGYFDLSVEVAVSTRAYELPLRLVKKGPAQKILAADDFTIADGVIASGVALTFPMGAYAQDATLSAAWLPPRGLAACPGDAQFLDEDTSIQHRVAGVLLVEVSSEPAKGVTVQLPLPPDAADAGGVSLYELDASGAWASPVAPTSMTATSATFVVSHFSAHALTLDREAASGELAYRVTEASPGASVQAGDVVPPGTSIKTPPDGFAALTDPRGSTVWVGGGGSVTMMDIAATSGTIDPDLHLPVAVGSGGVSFDDAVPLDGLPNGNSKQRTIANVKKGPYGAKRYGVRCKGGVGGVRGTVFDGGRIPCADANRAVCEYEVDEGELLIATDAGTLSIGAGKGTSLCGGQCASGAPAACCDGANCEATCSDPFGVCVPAGSTPDCDGQSYDPAQSECVRCGTASGVFAKGTMKCCDTAIAAVGDECCTAADGRTPPTSCQTSSGLRCLQCGASAPACSAAGSSCCQSETIGAGQICCGGQPCDQGDQCLHCWNYPDTCAPAGWRCCKFAITYDVPTPPDQPCSQ